MTDYENRQRWDLDAWPGIYGKPEELPVVAVAGLMNRSNDGLTTVTDAESADWARDNPGPLGWDIGKHTGGEHEQRSGPPGS